MKGLDGRLTVLMNQVHADSVTLKRESTGLWLVNTGTHDPRTHDETETNWGQGNSARRAMIHAEQNVCGVVLAEIQSRRRQPAAS